MNQSCCWAYNQPYILFELKRSHRCLVWPSKVRQGARKAAVTGKWCQNSWTKRFQGKPNGKNVENTIKNPIKLCLRRKNEVGGWFRGNRQTDRHTHTHRTTTVTLRRMRRGLTRRLMDVSERRPSQSRANQVSGSNFLTFDFKSSIY